jgi:two-component system cell cycle response regulator
MKCIESLSFVQPFPGGIQPVKTNTRRVDEPQTENLNLATGQLQGFEFKESFCLVVMTGPGKGTVHNLSCGQTSLGRSERTDLPVVGKGISRVHATLMVEDEKVTLVDNGSTNGVFVQGVRVRERRLFPGDVFGLGPELKVRLESTDGGLHELIEEMYRSSKIDALTNLMNRRAFEERMDEEFSVTRRHGLVSCLAILDIDHFKTINDTRGHDAGDEVLREVAAIIQREVRTGDLVGRWGGEEFVVYVRQSDLEGAKKLLDRLRNTVHETSVKVEGGDDINVTFSAGVVSLHESNDWRKSLGKADEGLYQSKESGRNRVTEVS